MKNSLILHSKGEVIETVHVNDEGKVLLNGNELKTLEDTQVVLKLIILAISVKK